MKSFYFFIIVLAGTSLFAQSHTFTSNGGTTDWHTAANWSANSIPSNTSTVEIPDGFTVLIEVAAVAQSLTLSGSGTLILEANLSVTETFSIENVAVLSYDLGVLTAGTIENNGTIRFINPQSKTITNTVLNNNGRIDFITSNNINLSGTTTINNATDGVIDILANGGLTQTDGATATLINNGLVQKYTENGDFGSFYMILDVINNGTLDIAEDNQYLFLTPSVSLHNTATGILSGTGFFDITSPFLNEGTISPGGDDVGTLSFFNSFRIDNGKLVLDIRGLDNHDKIDVFSTDDLSGEIIINSLEDSEAEDIFSIITAGFFVGSCDFPNEIVYDDDTVLATFSIQCSGVSLDLKLDSLISLGIDEHQNLNFSITPNPIIEEALISLNQGQLESPQLNVFDVSGTKVRSVLLDSEATTFNRDSLTSGLYFAQLISEGKVIHTEKIIIK